MRVAAEPGLEVLVAGVGRDGGLGISSRKYAGTTVETPAPATRRYPDGTGAVGSVRYSRDPGPPRADDVEVVGSSCVQVVEGVVGAAAIGVGASPRRGK